MRVLFLLCWVLLVALPAAEPTRQHVEVLLAALTDSRAAVNRPAMQSLIASGPSVLPDLAVLASDADAALRARVAEVAGGIGGPAAFRLCRQMLADEHDLVRQVAALQLGRVGSGEAYPLLAPLLIDSHPGVREAAALALGRLGDLRAIADLARWPLAGGDLDRLRLAREPEGERQLRRIRSSMQASLRAVLASPRAVPALSVELGRLRGSELTALLEASGQLADPRLSESLAALLLTADVAHRRLAALSLSANGDARALPALIAAAVEDEDPRVREAAATSLRRLTGHQAGPGQAWALWWRDRAERVEALARRDAFIASLHDPTFRPDRAALAAFSPEELEPLLDGVLGTGAAWWPSLAWRALRADDPARWTAMLAERYRSSDGARRVAMVVLLDGLGDPRARELLEEWWREIGSRSRDPETGAHPERSLRAALALALGKRP